MKMEKINFTSAIPAQGKPFTLIATGVAGGGYVSVATGSANVVIGGEEVLTNKEKHMFLFKTGEYYKIYLEEGEKLYSGGQLDTAYSVTVYVLYHNPDPSPESNPLNLTGTIQLGQL